MPQHVRQGFLDDTVGGQVGAGRQPPRRPAHLQLHGQPGGGHPADQRVELIQARLRAQCDLVVGRAEQAEQVPQLGHRRPAAGLHGEQRLLGFGGRTGQHSARRAGLHDHHAHVVRHHVVQFAGDAGPLGFDGAPGRGLVLLGGAA